MRSSGSEPLWPTSHRQPLTSPPQHLSFQPSGHSQELVLQVLLPACVIWVSLDWFSFLEWFFLSLNKRNQTLTGLTSLRLVKCGSGLRVQGLQALKVGKLSSSWAPLVFPLGDLMAQGSRPA